jgi:hypothetical protein
MANLSGKYFKYKTVILQKVTSEVELQSTSKYFLKK